MIERMFFEYLVNALWQLPLLLAGAWLLIRIARPPLLAQHLLWLFTLVAAVMLPARGCTVIEAPTPTQSVQIEDLPISPQFDAEPLAFTPIESNTLASVPSPVRPTLLERLAGDLPLHTGRVTVSASAVHWSVVIYAIVVALCLLRLLLSCFAAFRMRSSSTSRPLTLLESNLLKECARRIGLSHDRLPEIRSLDQPDASPMIIGVRKPVLLLPECLRHSSDPSFEDQHLIAILTHELTHVRRRDYLVNLIARFASLPVAWHPAVIAMHGRIRQTREMICDADAASIFSTSTTYARSLLTLAEAIIQAHPPVEAVGLFDRNRKTLEERIMKLTEPQLRVTLATRITRIAAGAVVLIAATTTAATLHLKPAAPTVLAAQTTTQDQTTQPATGQAAPPADAVTVQTPTPAPAPQAAPTPTATPAPQAAPVPAPKSKHKIYIDGEQREMTPEEQEKFDKQMDEMHAQLRKAMSELDTAKLQQQIAAANLKAFSSPEYKKQMAEMQESLKKLKPLTTDQLAKLNGPEFKKQMEDLQLKIDSPEFTKQMEDMKIQMSDLKLQMKLKTPLVIMPDLDVLKQEHISIRANEPEFKKRMTAAQEQLRAQLKLAGSDSDKIQKAVDQFDKEVDAATKDLTRERTHIAPPMPPTPPTPPTPSAYMLTSPSGSHIITFY